jgi:hypothetical protein
MIAKYSKYIIGVFVLILALVFTYQGCRISKLKKQAAELAVLTDTTIKAEAARWKKIIDGYLVQSAIDHAAAEAAKATAEKAKEDYLSVAVLSRKDLAKALSGKATIEEKFTLLSKEHEVALVALDKADIALAASEKRVSVLQESLVNAEKTINDIQKERLKTIADMTKIVGANVILTSQNKSLKTQRIVGVLIIAAEGYFAYRGATK